MALALTARAATTIWEGSKVCPMDWSGYQAVGAAKFSKATTDHMVRLRYKDLKAGAVAILRTGSWQQMPGLGDNFRELSGNHIDFVITADILKELRSNGCIVQGVGFTLTSVELITDEDLSKLTCEVPVTHNWLWTAGEKPRLVITIKNLTEKDTPVHAELVINTDKMKFYLTLSRDSVIKAGRGLNLIFQPELDPGFYKCTAMVNDEVARSFIFGFNPEGIVSAPDMQEDFEEFWQKTKDELAAVKPRYHLTEIPEKSSPQRKVYLLEMHSLPDGTGDVVARAYYAEPTGSGTYPAIIHFCGYDSSDGQGTPWCMNGNDNPDYCELILSTRGQVINNRPPYTNAYGDWFAYGFSSEYSYYYRGAYMDCVRAVDFLCSRQKVQRQNIFAEGTSQGGAFSIAAAALSDGRLNAIAPSVPFMGDFPDYFKVASWPGNVAETQRKHYGMSEREMYRMLSYFDTKNLATMVTCPVYMNYSLQDNVCPPHTNWAPYNNFASSEKKYQTNATLGHSTSSTWWSDYHRFFEEHLRPADGIGDVTSQKPTRAVIYDLAGRTFYNHRKVPGRGIYIRNHKKIIIK